MEDIGPDVRGEESGNIAHGICTLWDPMRMKLANRKGGEESKDGK
jgi:hypothetical protein